MNENVKECITVLKQLNGILKDNLTSDEFFFKNFYNQLNWVSQNLTEIETSIEGMKEFVTQYGTTQE